MCDLVSLERVLDPAFPKLGLGPVEAESVGAKGEMAHRSKPSTSR
jgi:hypothetical protein